MPSSKSLLIVAFALTLVFAVPTAAITVGEDGTSDDVVLESTSKYASTEDSELELDFEALNDRAVTSADGVFTITVADEAVEAVWIDHDIPGLTFYKGNNPSNTISRSMPLEPSAGETTRIGVAVDTHVAQSGTETFTVHVRYGDEGSLEKKPVPTVELTELDVSPKTLETGENVTVNATYRNEGSDVVTHTSRLTVDGTIVDQRTFALEPGETKSVVFERSMHWPGTYDVGVDGTDSRSVTVTGPPIDVVSVTIDTPTITVGDSARIGATVANPTGKRVERTLELEVDGIVVDSRVISIPANDERTITFERRFDESGTYEIGASRVAAGTVTVDEPATFRIRNRELSAATTAALAPPATAGLLVLAIAANRRWAYPR